MPICISPPELTDGALLRFLDGLADTEVEEHLGICEYCSHKLRNLERGMREMTRRVYRAACPSSMDLTAYHLGELPGDEAIPIREHLELCAACRQEIIQFNHFLNTTAESEPQTESLLKRAEILIGSLLNAGGVPAFAGVRGAGEAVPRVYQAGEFQITITIEEKVRTAGRFRLTGLFLGASKVEWTADLWHSEKLFASAVVNNNGEFSFESLEQGIYTLILDSLEREIYLQDIEV